MFRRLFRPLSGLACVLTLGGTVLTITGCSHIAPLGPGQADATPKMPPPQVRSAAAPVPDPQPSPLRSPFVLAAVRMQTPESGGVRCPVGSIALSAGQCYRRVGAPVTFTVAGVSPIQLSGPPGTVQATFYITVTAGERPALTAVTEAAFESHPHGFLDITVGGRTWLLPEVVQPFTQPEFEITLPRAAQTLLLRRLLAPSG